MDFSIQTLRKAVTKISPELRKEAKKELNDFALLNGGMEKAVKNQVYTHLPINAKLKEAVKNIESATAAENYMKSMSSHSDTVNAGQFFG